MQCHANICGVDGKKNTKISPAPMPLFATYNSVRIRRYDRRLPGAGRKAADPPPIRPSSMTDDGVTPVSSHSRTMWVYGCYCQAGTQTTPR